MLRMLRPFEIAPAPAHRDNGAVFGNRTVLEGERGARAFEQGLGDENAQAQSGRQLAGFVGITLAAGDIGLADAVQDFRREARTVIADGHLDCLFVPLRADPVSYTHLTL